METLVREHRMKLRQTMEDITTVTTFILPKIIFKRTKY